MASSPFLTVIVPTRERPDTLLHCLRTVAAQDDPRLEILVSDNCSGLETKAAVGAVTDSRLRYIRPERRLGMSEHWEFALAQARGDWITFIGDDDGLLPGAVRELSRLVEGTNIKAVASDSCEFIWPNPRIDRPSNLVVKLRRGAELRSSRAGLVDLMLRSGRFADLPFTYTGGFVRSDLVSEIKGKTGGRFFTSIYPDIYSAIAVCSATPSYLYSFAPLAIGGTSWHSNGAEIARTPQKGLDQIPFFQENTLTFHPLLGDGRTRSMQVLLYESWLQSQPLRDFELPIGLEQQLSLILVYARKEMRDELSEYCRGLAAANGIDFAKVTARVTPLRWRWKARRELARFRRRIESRFSPRQVEIGGDPSLHTIDDAARRSRQILDERKASSRPAAPLEKRSAHP